MFIHVISFLYFELQLQLHEAKVRVSYIVGQAEAACSSITAMAMARGSLVRLRLKLSLR
jgi:hypothetical protein